ncbi:AHH domain-containing protein [Stieleria sp. ICT_E10.1]|uniref:AHH domain-containing protein n=1 Tax=Stieleria sedimenti TaxID=2976331 RepID=UPI0021804BFB|nr:AHH domain-containing protein [Stieleria sedimenti]MCS7466708.1 AHH domain-containing protein [Stieleria sedimenti]
MNTGGADVPGVSPAEQLHACDWKQCEEDHKKKIDYPGDGKVKHSSNYASKWGEHEPWVMSGNAGNTGKRAELADYREETKSARYAVNAAAMTDPNYHTQKHHLISVNLFGKVSDLSHDAKLIGYDVNHINNGSCFPSYAYDIFRHDMQCHRGSHPNAVYNDHIMPILLNLEKKCITYCQRDSNCDTSPQQGLIQNLNAISAVCFTKLLYWEWFLRSKEKALRERKESFERQNLAVPT